MSDTVRIDLHGHSTFSDGLRSPAQIAALCAMREVRFAALTDHNNIDGQEAFEAACELHGIGYISGLELHTLLNGRDVHLLCYGFDRNNRDLCRALTDLKASRAGTGSAYAVVPQPGPGKLIRTVHHAGGIVLLAHPLLTEPDRSKLESMLDDLSALGLDGLEIQHPHLTGEDQHVLNAIATTRQGFIVSAGTDHHGRSDRPEPALGVDVSLDTWRAFRDRLTQRRKAMPHPEPSTEAVTNGHHNGRAARRMLVPMVLPALAVIVLFTLALFGFFLPAFEKALLERKRETIQELTRTIWSMLDEAEKQVQSGRLTQAVAQEEAVERVRGLRYGRESLDYFWIQDLSPRMIMHPYRTDLEGRDLSGFRDPLGSPIFNLFADKVRQDGAGYVDYVWQWKDNPDRLEAKESFIKLFEPWGWVIGTGLYMNDVRAEIRNLELRIYHVMLAITAVLVLLLLYMLRGGLKSERLRFSAEQRLHESNARYASLVKAASEGVLFVRNRRCVYANPVFLELAGCDADELALLDWQELFPDTEPWEPPPTQPPGSTAVHRVTPLRRREGPSVACRISLKGMPEGGAGSFVVLVRRADEPAEAMQAADESLLKRLLNLPASTAGDIARQIARTTTPEAVIECCQRTPDLVRAMLDSSAAPTAIAAMLTSITDAATVKFIELTQQTIGAEPVPFAFVVVGSQGRQEQTLYTDQDNIVIYETPPPEIPHPLVADYFKTLSERVCALLVQAGYRECTGQLMASNPKWRNSIDDWLLTFSRWIGKAEGHEAMDFMTLFDMRCVYGQANLVKTLRTHIDREIGKSPWFFTQAARNAVHFKTPLRIFGTIVTAGRASEKSGHLDLKAALMPIVCYARLYALKHQLHSTATPERLSSLCDQGFLLPSLHQDIMTAFETLMRLRLRHQSDVLRNGGEPDNLVRLAQLGHIDEAVLKECFHDIDRIQDRIGKEFLGGEPGNQ